MNPFDLLDYLDELDRDWHLSDMPLPEIPTLDEESEA